MKLPDQIPVKELASVHPDYDDEHLERCKALYHGGRIFRDNLDKFLIKRKIEDKDTSHYDLRKRRCFYVPYSAGLLDWIGAAAFREGLMLRVKGGSAEAKEYYESLNTDADGLGTPLLGVAIQMLLSAMKYGRSYVFPDFTPENEARITQLCPCRVDDWQKREDGELEWVRMHCREALRDESKPWDKATDSKESWTFFDEQNITVFECITSAKGGRGEQIAKRIEQRPHGLGMCPVVDVRAPDNIWVMDRIFEVAVALFNREASLAWSLDMSAYATMVLVLNETQISQIVSTELAALRLRPGESVSYAAPPGGVYEPLFKDADRLKANLYEVVRSLGVDSAKIPQAGRLSGEAIGKIREPMEVLLDSFSRPVLEALARFLEIVKLRRGDDVELELVMQVDNQGAEDGEEDTAPPGAGAGADDEAAGADSDSDDDEED